MPAALLAKSVLSSASIECILSDENLIRMDWLWSNFLGGVKLWVAQDDADAAADLLDQPMPESFEVSGIGEYKQPKCSNCGSADLAFRELLTAFAVGLYFGLPIPVRRRGWRCHSCGREWREDDEQKILAS